MLAVGFLYSFAMVVLSLLLMTMITYAWPDSWLGKTFGILK